MKILYVLNSGNPGGMEQHVLDLVRGMILVKHEVFVWCKDGSVVQWYKNAGAKVLIEEIKSDIDPKYIIKLSKFLKEEKIDIIHCHELLAVGNGLIAAFISGTKVRITHIHTPFSEWPVSSFRKKVYSFFYSIAIKLFGVKEIALTESRKKVKIKEGLSEKDLYVIANGLDTARFLLSPSKKIEYKKEILDKYKISSDRCVFGCVSRLTQEKGHFILIEAFSNFLQLNYVNKEFMHLLIAGGGTLENELRTKVKELDLERHVTITGVFAEEDKIKLYSSLDFFVFPSLAEGFGIVLMEAMCVALPIVCSDLEVLGEVGGSCVRYFETGNAQDLSQKMYDLYVKKDNLDSLKECAQKRVLDLFTIEKFWENYEKLYTSLLEAK